MKKVDEKIMQMIADQLAQGLSLTEICKDKKLPSSRTVLRAVINDDGLYDIYNKGRILQAEFFGDKINELAQRPLPDSLDPRQLNAEVQLRRLEIDTLKWTLARMQPFGIRNKKEDVKQPAKLVIGWAEVEEPTITVEVEEEVEVTKH
tara:strand:- start:21489 stop:21932 length:444 start_codon:yes stop_codon:yes gene_type:complete